VIDADTSLRQPDLRARERTFQLIAQVAGRTGRGPRGGLVLVQTSCPDDPAIQFAARHDFLGFAHAELAERQACQAPPYAVAARLIVRGPTEAAVCDSADRLKTVLQRSVTNSGLPVRLLGPCPCPILRLQGRFRYHLQMTAATREPIQQLWQLVAADLSVADGVEFVVDVDPLSSR
jgi:primosomal protein N' (replication factor Y)